MVSLLGGCGNKRDSLSPQPIINQNRNPVANAGPNRVVLAGVNITLEGSGSSDADGDALAYSWSLIRKPAGSTAVLSNATSVNPSFTSDKDGLFVAELIVSDGTGSSAPVTVTITRSSPSCSTDDILKTQTTGSMIVGPSEDFIPLCNGVVLFGDRELNQIRLLDVVSGGTGTPFQLTAAPKGLALDPDNDLLYAAHAPATFLTRMDLLSGAKSQITLSKGALNLAVVGGGRVFASLDENASNDHPLALVSGLTGTVEQEYPGDWDPYPGHYGHLLAYDPVHGQLFSANSYDLVRYSFDPNLKTLTQVESLTGYCSNGEDLAISPDGEHVAYACGGGNGPGYSIYDFSSTAMGYIYGAWETGAYPASVAFDPSGAYVAATDTNNILIFDTSTHVLLQTYPVDLSDCSSPGLSRVRFSRGGNIVFAYAFCGFWSNSGKLFWVVLQP
ncbi:MAG: PKD domain-containing protein [Nitrospirota bacterium]